MDRAGPARGGTVTDIFAHRGSAHLARENTVAAFVAAAELGADGVELDVRRTADGHMVVHHDAEVPGLGQVARLAARELPDWLPSLGAALDACRPVKVNVEIKHDRERSGSRPDDQLARQVAALVAGRLEAPSIVVSSFSLSVVDTVRAMARTVTTALLAGVADDPFQALATTRGHGHAGLHPFFGSIDEELVRQAKAAGISLRAWTVDDPARVALLAEMGVDAVITNDVRAARRALGRS
jgi:glycerophosphoryl diester phosphodiesterase